MSKDFENNNTNNGESNFGLPEGYFKKSAGNILNKIEWVEEHKPYPKLSELKKETGFVVPFNYFETSEAKLELTPYERLSKLSKEHNFIIPENYFDETEISLLSHGLVANNEDDLQHFEYLNSIPKVNSFGVSDSYFEMSAAKIISELSPKKEAKVISLFTRKALFSAAAALFAAIIGVWIYNQYFKTAAVQDCGTLACVDKNDLVKSKNLESLDNDELYELVDTKKLEEKLENKQSIKKENTSTDSSLKNVNTDDLLDEI